MLFDTLEGYSVLLVWKGPTINLINQYKLL